MKLVRRGDKVCIHYQTYAADGCLIESSEHREPFEFIAGSADVVSGISLGTIGMRESESRRIPVSPEQAFGYRSAAFQQLAPRLGVLEKIAEGEQLAVELNGTKLDLWARKTMDDEILLDANHPLAGESLIYDIQIIRIDSEEE
jgi:peptidylprolyl isomerase